MFKIDLTGRNAIITGAGSGLARETAYVLADCGANIVAADVDLAGAEETAAKVKEMGRKAIAVKCDVTQLAEVQAVFDAAKKELGQIDIVINAAGIGPMITINDATEADVRKIVDINLMGTEFGSKLALLTMKEQGKGGVVINFGSIASWLTTKMNPHYAMSKAAVISLTHQYALAGAAEGIRFNAVCPGIIRTPMWEKGLETLVGEAGGDQAARDKVWNERVIVPIPMGCPQEPVDIANAVAFFVSDQARYITGQSLNIDGGQIMR